MATATFTKADAGTQGNWGGRYGTEGYNIFRDVASYPGYAQVSRNGLAAWTWQDHDRGCARVAEGLGCRKGCIRLVR